MFCTAPRLQPPRAAWHYSRSNRTLRYECDAQTPPYAGARLTLPASQNSLQILDRDIAFRAGVGAVLHDDSFLHAGVAQAGEDHRRLGEVLVFGEVVERDDACHARGDRRQQAIARVLHDDAIRRVEVQALNCEVVDVGGGLLGLHHIPGEDPGELSRRFFIYDVVEYGLHGGQRRRGADHAVPACCQRLFGETLHAGPPGDSPGGNEFLIDLALALVPAQDGLPPLILGVRHVVDRAEVLVLAEAEHALLAAADLDLLGVLLQGPLPVDAVLAPHLVERNQVAVALSVGQNAVTVEDECVRHALPSLPKILK